LPAFQLRKNGRAKPTDPLQWWKKNRISFQFLLSLLEYIWLCRQLQLLPRDFF
jgi:hypothetical protein